MKISDHRVAAVIVCAIGVVTAFVAFAPWPVDFGAAVGAAAAWCAWLERDTRPAKLLQFPDVQPVAQRRRRTVA